MTLQDIEPGPLLEQVFDATFPVWGDGLSRQAYARWNEAQRRTRWGQRHLQRVGLVDGHRVVASAKRYLFDVHIDGRSISVSGVGAVFTPEALRGRGLATQLIDAMVADAAARGCACVVLFSEIGPAYYARLGFTPVPRVWWPVDVPRSRRGAPGTMVRGLEVSDLADLAAIAQRYAPSHTVSLHRSAELMEYGITRKRLRAGLGPNGLRQVEVFVSEEGHKPVSWVVLSRGPEGVRVEDCGDRDPSGARVGAMLEALAERDPSSDDRTLKVWFPAGVRPPQVQIGAPVPADEIMMVRTLPGALIADHVWQAEPYWPALDVF